MVDPLHFSQLKRMADSPAHYAYALAHPMKQSKAMRLGAAVDALVFDMPEDILNETRANQRAWLEAKAVGVCSPGKGGIAEVLLALGMYDALRANSDAWRLLTEGAGQHKISWDIAGRRCEGTPDVFTARRLVDLKTTRSAHPDRFARDGRFRGYHAQLAWYSFGLSASGKAAPKEHLLVTVENVPPHPVTVFEVTPAALLAGEKIWRSWFERLMVCEASGNFPGYTESRVPFDVPEDGSLSLIIDGDDVELE